MHTLTTAFALSLLLATRLAGQGVLGPDTVMVENDGLTLRGLLWRPAGMGPFPAILFNHGSGRTLAQLTAGGAGLRLGPLFAGRGYVFLMLFRRGAGLSEHQGSVPGDTLTHEFAAHGVEARNKLQLRLLEGSQLRDAMAGLTFLRARPDVDRRRLAVIGHSFGGALTLLMAERDSSLRAVVDFAGAANSWRYSPQLRERLRAAVRATVVPVFFIHAANDYSIAPGTELAADMEAAHRPGRLRIYAAFGPTTHEGHNFVFLDTKAWVPDVLAFLDQAMGRGRRRTTGLRVRSPATTPPAASPAMGTHRGSL